MHYDVQPTEAFYLMDALSHQATGVSWGGVNSGVFSVRRSAGAGGPHGPLAFLLSITPILQALDERLALIHI